MNTKETINDKDITVTHSHTHAGVIYTKATMLYRGAYRVKVYADFDSIAAIKNAFKDYVKNSPVWLPNRV